MNRREFLLGGVAACTAGVVALSAPAIKTPASTRREGEFIVYRFALPASLEPAETHELVTLLHAQTALEIQRYCFVVNVPSAAGRVTECFDYPQPKPLFMTAGDSLHATFTPHLRGVPFSIQSGVFAVYARQQGVHVSGLVKA